MKLLNIDNKIVWLIKVGRAKYLRGFGSKFGIDRRNVKPSTLIRSPLLLVDKLNSSFKNKSATVRFFADLLEEYAQNILPILQET